VNFQHISNPAYNSARGPVNIFSFRVHAEFWALDSPSFSLLSLESIS
jgi:hypothetical protein